MNVFGVIGNTLRTASGVTFCIANPDPAMVNVFDIAHALSRICRFGGHVTVEHYSVAEHCLNCLSLARRNCESREVQLAVLMHDAAEAYIGDVIKPLKILMPEYGEIERRVERVIGQAFSIDFELHAEAIRKYDHALLVAEKNAFLRNGCLSFKFDGEHHVLDYGIPLKQLGIPPSYVAQLFVDDFKYLTEFRA